jgi:hypothetical protein
VPDKIFLHSKHVELWQFLADHPDKEKWQWSGWKDIPKQVNDCFACDYAKIATSSGLIGSCADCPLIWDTKHCDDSIKDKDGADGLFYLWDVCEDLKERSKLAAQIRDLPVREGVVCG